jgi:membrane protein YdbS with pleckstrin-like domain
MTNSFQNLQVYSFPEVSEITFNSIHKNYLKVIFFNTFLFFLLFFVGLTVAVYFDLFEEISEYVYLFYLGITFVFSSVLLIKFIGFKKRKYAIRDKDISYKCGIFFKSLTTVPFNRIQHIEIDEGPISRFFGLSSLNVFTAGDSSDDLEISGLLQEDALKIKEFISTKIDG